MKITGIRVDSFGTWRDLKIDDLSQNLNVFYGPNEAGKTTLLEFIRCVLYGLTDSRRHYLASTRGATGGELDLITPRGPITVERSFAYSDRNGPEGTAGTLQVFDKSAHPIEEFALSEALHNVQEGVFSRVFAVGLRELQELGSLTDAGAAKLLYETTLGLDGVSLWEMMEELNSSTVRLWGPEESNSQLPSLVERRNKLEEKQKKANRGGAKYAQLVARKRELEQAASKFDERKKAVESEAKLVETAIGLSDRWRKRRSLKQQLRSWNDRREFPVDGRARYSALLAKYQEALKDREVWKKRGLEAQSQLNALGVNHKVRESAGKISALAEQQPYLLSLEKQIDELESETRKLQAELSGDFQHLGLKDGKEGDANWLTAPSIAPLRQAGKAIHDAEREIRRREEALVAAQSRARQLEERIRKALQIHEVEDLRPAIDKIQSRLAQLRNRSEIDEKLEKLLVRRTEFQDEYKRLAEDQVLPQRTMALTYVVGVLGIAGCFMTVARMVFSGLENVVPNPMLTGSASLLASIGAMWVRSWWEDEADAASDQARRQLLMADAQIAQIERERHDTDTYLQRDGAHPARIADLERELEELERIRPLEQDYAAARDQELDLERSIPEAKEDLAAAKDRFRSMAAEFGLPASIDLEHVQTLGDRRDELSELQRKLNRRRDDLKLKRQELEQARQRVSHLVVYTGISGHDAAIPRQIAGLLEELRKQESLQEQHRGLENKVREARSRFDAAGRRVLQLNTRRRALFAEVGAKDFKSFQKLHREQMRVQRLRKNFAALEKEIVGAIPHGQSESQLSPLLTEERMPHLEDEWTRLTSELDALDAQSKQGAEERGRLSQLIESALASRDAVKLRSEARALDRQIRDTLEQWQTRVLVRKWFDSLRERYEKDRQPQALTHGARYFEAMTQGRYRRVWTRLGARSLLADDLEGNVRGADALSRGCREQLFLSLRLALIDLYARNGVHLPVVLDDVLVNFDDERATAAARVIQQFASGERQVFVFTCHEHVVRIFESLGVQVRRLPEHQKTVIVEAAPAVEAVSIQVAESEPPQGVDGEQLTTETQSIALEELPEERAAPIAFVAPPIVEPPRAPEPSIPREKRRIRRRRTAPSVDLPPQPKVDPPALPPAEPLPGVEWEWEETYGDVWEEEDAWQGAVFAARVTRDYGRPTGRSSLSSATWEEEGMQAGRAQASLDAYLPQRRPVSSPHPGPVRESWRELRDRDTSFEGRRSTAGYEGTVEENKGHWFVELGRPEPQASSPYYESMDRGHTEIPDTEDDDWMEDSVLE